ncbi:MAG: hypothetical protein KFF73_01570 [Cyclobacteriaceae bacterium]|nr:hypothetical protein [Cyclobacteriaceae bacterium]
MKTMKKNMLTLGLLFMMLGGVVTAWATENTEKKDPYRTYDYDDYYNTYMMEKEIEELMYVEGQVRIIDFMEELVAEGMTTDNEIKKYVGISDLLIDVDGVKYYRLSYK